MAANDVRARILSEFNRQMYIYGYEKTTLKNICKELSISTGHLYHYFKRKEDLYEALQLDFFAKLQHILKDHLKVMQPSDLLILLLCKYYYYWIFIDQPPLYRVMLEMQHHTATLMFSIESRAKEMQNALQNEQFSCDFATAVIAEQTFLLQTYSMCYLREEGVLEAYSFDAIFWDAFRTWCFNIGLSIEQTHIYQTSLSDVVSILDKQAIYDKIYEMDSYDYEFSLNGSTNPQNS